MIRLIATIHQLRHGNGATGVAPHPPCRIGTGAVGDVHRTPSMPAADLLPPQLEPSLRSVLGLSRLSDRRLCHSL